MKAAFRSFRRSNAPGRRAEKRRSCAPACSITNGSICWVRCASGLKMNGSSCTSTPIAKMSPVTRSLPLSSTCSVMWTAPSSWCGTTIPFISVAQCRRFWPLALRSISTGFLPVLRNSTRSSSFGIRSASTPLEQHPGIDMSFVSLCELGSLELGSH